MNKYIILIFFLFVSACSTQAQRESESLNKNLANISSQVEACLADMRSKENSILIYKTTVVYQDKNGYAPNRFELVRNNNFLDDSLLKNFSNWLLDKQKCNSILINSANSISPRLYRSLINSTDFDDKISLDLMNKKLTIGEYNQLRIDLLKKSDIEISEIFQEINNDLRNRHNAEVETYFKDWNENYQRALDRSSRERALNLQQNNRQVINPTTTTNCYKVGNQINCTSY